MKKIIPIRQSNPILSLNKSCDIHILKEEADMGNQEIEKKALWQNRVKRWSISGISQSMYCRQQNLSIRQFGYYKRKFGQAENSEVVELKKVKYKPGAFIELVTPDVLMLRFQEDISLANFRNIIMSLRG